MSPLDSRSRRRSSTGQSHSPSSRPAAAVEPATLPVWAAFRSLARPCSLTCSTRCLIEVCALDSGTSAMPAATGFKVDVSTGCQQRLLIEDRHALEPALEERAAGLLLAVGQPRERLLQALHGPAQALQPLARSRDPPGVLQPSLDPPSETGATCRALSRGGKRRPQRRTTSSSDQPRAGSGSSRTNRCK